MSGRLDYMRPNNYHASDNKFRAAVRTHTVLMIRLKSWLISAWNANVSGSAMLAGALSRSEKALVCTIHCRVFPVCT